MSKGNGKRDPIGDFVEWQEHQYQEGYYVGGKIPPFYWGKRPSKFGYVLLATGIFTFLALAATMLTNAFEIADPSQLISLTSGGLIGTLQLLAGARLLQNPARKRRRH